MDQQKRTTTRKPASTQSGARTTHTQSSQSRAQNNTRRGNFGTSRTPRTQGRTSNRRFNKQGSGHGNNRGRNPQPRKPAPVKLPLLADGDVRVIPLGGVEEVGKNMLIVEYKNSIVIIDMGFQFVEEETPGIDYLLPNTKYLEDNKDKIRGVVITHGHLDHIGGIPYIMPRIGNPPIYTRPLTSLMIKKRQTEFKHLPSLAIHEVDIDEKIKLGDVTVGFFAVTHSIPDSMGVYLETPLGNVVLSGDLKLDHDGGKPAEHEKEVWGKIGKMNNLLFFPDSTNAENPGYSITEQKIYKTLGEIIVETPGRLIVGTFASQFARMVKIIELAEKHGRKVVTEGRSIKTNIEIAKESGLLKAQNIVPVEEVQNYPPEKLLILATGAQGEEFAALMRMANKKHRFISLTPQDTIVLSSSVIPGNEVSVQRLKDNLYRHGVKMIHYRVSDVHSSGHGNEEELAWIDKQVNARFYMPGYGYHSMVRVHGQFIVDHGIAPKENVIVADNGTIIDFTDGGKKFIRHKERAPYSDMVVDGLSIGDVQEVVIRDRQLLAQDGMFVVMVVIDTTTGRLRKSPDIISRGFVYLRESQDLLREARELVKKTVEDSLVGMHPINFDYVRDKVTDNVARLLLQRTAKRPIVIPVILGI